VEHPAEFQIPDGLLEARDVSRHGDEHIVVGFGARKLEDVAAVLEADRQIGERADDRFELLALLAELLRALRVVPDPRVLERAGDLP
jgi:hypothetical protein